MTLLEINSISFFLGIITYQVVKLISIKKSQKKRFFYALDILVRKKSEGDANLMGADQLSADLTDALEIDRKIVGRLNLKGADKKSADLTSYNLYF